MDLGANTIAPPHFDAVVFDFDGVLVESVDVKTQAFSALYQPFGSGVVEKVVSWHLAHGGVSRFEKFRHFHREFLNRELDAQEEADLCGRFSSLVEDAVIGSPWVPGAKEFLIDHWRKLPLYVASGTPEDELLRIVERRGMACYFRGVFGAPTKKTDILRRILSANHYPPERLLMVGDAMTDYDAAMEAGAGFLGRVPPNAANPFAAGVKTTSDLSVLASLL